jgi:hypothetical protein
MQDFGDDVAPEIPAAPNYNPSLFDGAWENYGAEQFLNYGRLPGDRFMINWPIKGNDYGEGVGRLIESKTSQAEFLQKCRWHSQNFAHFIQNQLSRRYGLAEEVFPTADTAFALHPYYRESRRLVGLTTIREQDILPVAGGRVASLFPDTVAIGNYANDHHYPGFDLPLQPKSIRWGGRWTGTPFTIPYRCLVPAATDGLLVCEKNISVSHIANGATRLQPVVMGIGQAAGMAAAMCVESGVQPRDLPVRALQEALLQDAQAPAAIIPLFNLNFLPNHPEWFYVQQYYLDRPQIYPLSEDSLQLVLAESNYLDIDQGLIQESNSFTGIFQRLDQQDYKLKITAPTAHQGQMWQLVTLRSQVDEQLQIAVNEQLVTIWGRLNYSGNWILVDQMDITST